VDDHLFQLALVSLATFFVGRHQGINGRGQQLWTPFVPGPAALTHQAIAFQRSALNLAAITAYLLRSVVHTVADGLSIGFRRVRERVLIFGGAVANPLLGTVAIGGAESAFG
jgi:hypothetical protein